MTTQADTTREQVRGRAVPVRGNDIDTDRIIPARFLLTVTFNDLGSHSFEDERTSAGHPFEDERYAGASILVVNANFGCGSSREHAPQALMRWGISAFVGESFGEIFFGNCIALGLPCLTASTEDINRLMSAVEGDPQLEVIADIAGQSVRFAGESIEASVPDGPREQLVKGMWDALGQLLRDKDEIAAKAAQLPYVNGFA